MLHNIIRITISLSDSLRLSWEGDRTEFCGWSERWTSSIIHFHRVVGSSFSSFIEFVFLPQLIMIVFPLSSFHVFMFFIHRCRTVVAIMQRNSENCYEMKMTFLVFLSYLSWVPVKVLYYILFLIHDTARYNSRVPPVLQRVSVSVYISQCLTGWEDVVFCVFFFVSFFFKFFIINYKKISFSLYSFALSQSVFSVYTFFSTK